MAVDGSGTVQGQSLSSQRAPDGTRLQTTSRSSPLASSLTVSDKFPPAIVPLQPLQRRSKSHLQRAVLHLNLNAASPSARRATRRCLNRSLAVLTTALRILLCTTTSMLSSTRLRQCSSRTAKLARSKLRTCRRSRPSQDPLPFPDFLKH